MLVLTRKKDERIVIGDDVWVTVLSVTGGKVKLGITGPLEIPVRREEIFTRQQHEQHEALVAK